MEAGHVNGTRGRQHAEFFRRKPAVSRNVSKHFFRRLAGKAAYSSANRRPERKDGFMDGHKVNDIARFAPVGGRGGVINEPHVPKRLRPVRVPPVKSRSEIHDGRRYVLLIERGEIPSGSSLGI